MLILKISLNMDTINVHLQHKQLVDIAVLLEEIGTYMKHMN